VKDGPETPDDEPSRLENLIDEVRFSRRSFSAMLVALVGTTAAGAQQARSIRRAPVQIRPEAAQRLRDIVAPEAPRTTFQIRRPDDMLVIYIHLRGLSVTGSAPNQRLVRQQGQRNAYIIFEHQPQHIAEQAFAAIQGEGLPEPISANPQSRISGSSRVVISMPGDISAHPWNLESLLEIATTWPMRLSGLARPAPSPASRLVLSNQLAGLSQARLDLASQVLLNALPEDERLVLADALPSAADRLARRMENAARSGETLSDAQVDAIISGELSQAMGSTARQSPRRQSISRAALEAAATSSAIDILQDVQAQPVSPGRRLNPNLTLAQINTPTDPGDGITQLELPYRLIQTPLASAGWSHASAPVAHAGRTELWHTRLGTRRDDGVDDFTTEPLRAIWSPDYGNPRTLMDDPPRWALYGDERENIVRLTAGFNERLENGTSYTPIPSYADKVILTALGGYLELNGNWNRRPVIDNTMISLENWEHRAATGRDYYVKVVKAGFLYPFGHRASLVRITERRFEMGNGGSIAPLRQRFYIVVREKSKTYSGAGMEHSGRNFPFTKVEILTTTTPDLRAPDNDPCYKARTSGAADQAFVPALGAEDYHFSLVGVDGAGRRTPFQAPLVLILQESNNASAISEIGQYYERTNQDFQNLGLGCNKGGRNRVPVNGAKIQFAPQALNGDSEGDTNIPTDLLEFGGAAPTVSTSAADPRFFPSVKKASVQVDQVKTLLGTQKNPEVEFSPRYLQHGFQGANAAGQAFLDIVQGTIDKIGPSEANPSDALGGLMSPDIIPSALSRTFGVVAGAAGAGGAAEEFFGAGDFDVSDFLPDAKILGAVDLKDVLSIAVDILSATGAVPEFKTIELPDKIEARLTMERTDLQPVAPLFDPMPSSRLYLDAVATASRDGYEAVEANASVEAELQNFQINLFSCFILTFDKLSFNAVPGSKPKVDVDLDPEYGVMFGGPLEFVNRLKDIIPMDGFGDPVPIALTFTGINASYSLTLPTIQVGICSIQNISLGAGFNISFTGGPPSARFNFAERHSPFGITVSMFGGGGFFAMVIDADGMKEVEASLEFGAKAELDIGVASGGVYVKGGFYFKLEQVQPDGQSVYFEGFVELGGHLSILGLISVSLVFHLALAYEKDAVAKTARLFGQASLTIEIEILFFSTSVSMKVERQFAGSEADPLFIDFIPTQGVWDEYCEAFA
jgi:hypothetical protein